MDLLGQRENPVTIYDSNKSQWQLPIYTLKSLQWSLFVAAPRGTVEHFYICPRPHGPWLMRFRLKSAIESFLLEFLIFFSREEKVQSPTGGT